MKIEGDQGRLVANDSMLEALSEIEYSVVESLKTMHITRSERREEF